MEGDSDFEDNSILQTVELSEESDSQGFDNHAGQTWIYPTNYPVREYQYNIIEKALFENTLVSLPTGLGKTFIAAVVMYNFYRWYPNGKIIFIAPTRPLVKQQIDACYKIMAIPEEATIELTGTKERKSRLEDWKSKRVFFVTPQVLQNDLLSVEELALKIRCIIFDEAHKARGNHAYCEVIRMLMQHNSLFRVLALSATPGSSVTDMKEIVQNLVISHLEFRTEESEDVKPYVFERVLETVVVPLDTKLHQVKDDYLELLERYTRSLIKYKIIPGNYSTLTKGKIFMVLKDFQEKNKNSRQPNSSEILKNLNICVTLYHAYELLIRHGLRSFLTFFDDHIDKPLLRGNIELIKIMEDVRTYLGALTIAEPLPDGTHTEVSENIRYGHPKFYKLEEILIYHFTKNKESSRTIVFFEYRESVKEAYSLLLKNTPLIRPRIFLGQGSGITQRAQMSVVQAFRDGHCNTLLSTCIGEEGLDVGEINLIVCFDISNKSPVRMIQRMGRTGRKREGRVIILVTEGKEQQTLQECLVKKKYLGSNLSTSPELHAVVYKKCPRMVPDNILPKCEKVYITVKKTGAKKNMNLKDMFKSKYMNSPSSVDYGEESEIFKPITERLKDAVNFWNESKPLLIDDKPTINFLKYIDKNRKLQYCGETKHSTDTHILVSLLQLADLKRFNIPCTQHCTDSNQAKILKQGDIRSIFKKTLALNDVKLSQSSPVDVIDINHLQSAYDSDITDEALNEISAYLSINDSSKSECEICSKLFTCPRLPVVSGDINLTDWVQPDLTMLYTLNKAYLNSMFKRHVKSSQTLSDCIGNSDIAAINTVPWTDTFSYDSTANIRRRSMEDQPLKQTETSFCTNKPKTDVNSNKVSKHFLNCMSIKEIDDLLNFFRLKSLEDLFMNKSPCDVQNSSDHEASPKREFVVSSPESPILCTYQKSQSLKSNAANKLHFSLSESTGNPKNFSSHSNIKLSNKLSNQSAQNLRDINASSKKELSPGTEVETRSSCYNHVVEKELSDFADIEDIFDLSIFSNDLESKDEKIKPVNIPNVVDDEVLNKHNSIIDTADICDLSLFGLSVDNTQKRKSETEDQINTQEMSKRIKLDNIQGDASGRLFDSLKETDKGTKPSNLQHIKSEVNSSVHKQPDNSEKGQQANTSNLHHFRHPKSISRLKLKESQVGSGGKNCDLSLDSQVTITQILSFIDKKSSSNCLDVKEDHFKEFLNKMK